MLGRLFVALLLAGSSTAAFALNAAPQPVLPVDTIPAAKDVPYGSPITLKVDVTDLDRAVMRVTETVPVDHAGPLTLLYPKWLPGEHAPVGPIDKLAGLEIRAGGKTLTWTRDTVDVFAIHVDVPPDVKQLDLSFQYLSPTDEAQGPIHVLPTMTRVEWEKVSLYPAGFFVRQVPVLASLTVPAGWQVSTALRAASTNGATTVFEPTNYEVLVDSPVLAGKYFRTDVLSPGITLDSFAEAPRDLVISPNVLNAHKALASQADKLFGARHFDHYDFLLTLSARADQIGLEHHRSSEDGVGRDYFTDWSGSLEDHNLLPHEYVHSWNGKFRRPADLWTPDYRVPMRDSLLWVYEGQTQFWGYVLEARSGLASKADTLGAIAAIAADLDTLPARKWRSLDDTTNDPVIAQRRPKAWTSWQRAEDYYNEGLLIWVEADAIIRQGTRGVRGMDDFARTFFGNRNGDYGEVTYTFDDVVQTLNGVLPYDWKGFLNDRLMQKGDHAPLGGLTRSGYRLAYTDTPTNFMTTKMKARKTLDLSYSLGLSVGKDGKITDVIWDGPAFRAGLTVGEEVIAANGMAYSDPDFDKLDDALSQAVAAAKGGAAAVQIIVRSGDRVRDVAVQWNGGPRYPRLEKV